MTYQGRSLDDLPLAAYSTGVVDDDAEEEPVPEPPHLSQQEAVALAMGIEPAEPSTADAATADAATAGSGSDRPRLTMPKPSLPRPSLPRLPRLGGRRRATVVTESPFNITAQPATPAGYASAASAYAPAAPGGYAPAAPGGYAPAASAYAPSPFAMPAQAPAVGPRAGGIPGIPGRIAGLDLGGLGAKLRNPRAAVRDPRVLFGGMVAIGVVLLGASMLGGGDSSGAAPGAGASHAPGAGGPTGPGPASIQVAGDFDAAFDLTGTAGFGKPADGQVVATWDDGAGTTIALTGPVGGTRTTAPELTLAITVMRNGTPVTFTSEAGECTIGMAEKMSNISGSFVCPEITSKGGRFTVKLTGTYQT